MRDVCAINQQKQQINTLWITVSCVWVTSTTACFRLWYDITSSLQTERLKSLLVRSITQQGRWNLYTGDVEEKVRLPFNLREVRFHSKHKTWSGLTEKAPARCCALWMCAFSVKFMVYIQCAPLKKTKNESITIITILIKIKSTIDNNTIHTQNNENVHGRTRRDELPLAFTP